MCVENFLINVSIVHTCIHAQSLHTGNLTRRRALFGKKPEEELIQCQKIIIQWCNHYILLAIISFLLSICSNQFLQILPLHLSSIYLSVTHLSPSFSSSLVASIYLFYSPFAPQPFHPSHSIHSDSSVIRWQWRQ